MSAKTNKITKKRGLSNPAALIAAGATPEVVKTTASGASQVNKDTKGGLSILVLFMVAAGLYTVWKITAPFRSAAAAVSGTIDGIFSVNEDQPIPIQGHPTITQLQAKSRAAMLHDAMRGAGTDWPKIVQSLSGLTVADFTFVANEFGVKTYAPNGSGWWGDKLNLLGWLQRELSSKEIEQINTIRPGILK